MEEIPTILVVEDDLDVQTVLEEALTDGGFPCAIAGSAEEAVTLLLQSGQKFRALVLDISLKGNTSGWAAARRAREMQPNIPIIYTTAGGGDEWPSHGVPNSILLQKPFATAQLITAISQFLNKGPHSR